MINSQKSTFFSVLSTNFERGIIIFILGVTHQLLLPFPKFQMFTLIFIELIWLCEKIIVRTEFIHSFLFFVSLLESLVRIYFQITCLVYS